MAQRIHARFVESACGIGGWFVIADAQGETRIFADGTNAENLRRHAATIETQAVIIAADEAERRAGLTPADVAGADVFDAPTIAALIGVVGRAADHIEHLNQRRK